MMQRISIASLRQSLRSKANGKHFEMISPAVHAILRGATIMVLPQAKPRLNPAEADLAKALTWIADKHGTFDESGCGIYAAYEPGATNETQNIGVKCANCVLYQGGDKCRIINLPVEPTGKCRFAVIPDGVVKGTP